MAGKSVPQRSFRLEILGSACSESCPTSQAKYLIMEGSDVVARACEPPHVADHSWRVDRHAAAGGGLCLRAGGLADPAGALRQPVPGWGSHRYALSHSLAQD